ncbi:MAG: glucose 1-dehydrogenase [Acidimicrobiales bacterium]|jgi:threonine dehydrogenase-like Zn-dependent dehydrogenase
MKAITVLPGTAGSAQLDDFAEPPESDGPVLVDVLAVGICGTDLEISAGAYGWAPEGHERLVLGHESIGRVAAAPDGCGLAVGDYVVGIVRRPDPVPCYSCANGEWDFCRNGQYTEHGIKSLDGFMRERYRALPDAVVKVDEQLGLLGVLLEPTSVVAKAWEQALLAGNRAKWDPQRAVITGAGPIGLLAALIGVQRGLDVHVIDQVTSGLKPDLVAALGATYHTGKIEDACASPDVIVECTGVGSLIFDAMDHLAPGGVLCLTGVSPSGRTLSIDAGMLNRDMVLENECVVGSVNANRRHYEAAAEALAKADKDWLGRLLTRKVPAEDFASALQRQSDDVKVVIDMGGAG